MITAIGEALICSQVVSCTMMHHSRPPKLVPGVRYEALRALRGLYATVMDLHDGREAGLQREGLRFQAGEVVRHKSLAYR
jgi:hypothetical protein